MQYQEVPRSISTKCQGVSTLRQSWSYWIQGQYRSILAQLCRIGPRREDGDLIITQCTDQGKSMHGIEVENLFVLLRGIVLGTRM